MPIPIYHDSTEEKGRLGPAHYYRGAETKEELMEFIRSEVEKTGGRKLQVIADMGFDTSEEGTVYKSGGSPLEYFDDLDYPDEMEELEELGEAAVNMATRRAIITAGYTYDDSRWVSDWGVIFYD